MEQISLLGGHETEYQLTQKLKYAFQKMRKVKNNGAILIIVWNILLLSVYQYLLIFVATGLKEGPIAWGVTLPIVGWMINNFVRRYKVIQWSIWIMWITSILATLNSVIDKVVMGYHNFSRGISLTMISIMAIGFGGYQANAIQFGLDQLQDASTTEITAFISWYVWTYYSTGAIVSFLHMCMKQEYHIFGLLVTCTCVTLVVCSLFLFEKSLTKEPKTQNPITLIYRVIRYAIKHKHPEQRSAFTYCEDELPSRIDFGKSKYGGPFTTEQVEDVKTFLRLQIVIIPISVLSGEIAVMDRPTNHILFHIQQPFSTNARECYLERFFTVAFGCSIIAIIIPLYEFVIYPILYKYLPSIKIYQKIFAGMVLQLARLITLIVLDVVARKTYIEEHGKNITINCIFHLQQDITSSFNSKWIALERFLQSTSLTVLGIGGIEFLTSQSPYSMRGFIISTVYGNAFLFAIVEYGIYWSFTLQSSTWSKGIISCEFWYLLSVFLVLLISSGLLLVVGRWYKNRKREDVLPNKHIFAERYYSQET